MALAVAHPAAAEKGEENSFPSVFTEIRTKGLTW
jgi:hypothetical protein